MDNIPNEAMNISQGTENGTTVPQPGNDKISQLDPERGDRLTMKRDELHKLHAIPADERKEVLYGMWRWMEGDSEEAVVADALEVLSLGAVVLLTMIIDNQKIRAGQYHRRVEAQAFRAMRRMSHSYGAM